MVAAAAAHLATAHARSASRRAPTPPAVARPRQAPAAALPARLACACGGSCPRCETTAGGAAEETAARRLAQPAAALLGASWPTSPQGQVVPVAAAQRLEAALGLRVAEARLYADGTSAPGGAMPGARAWTWGAQVAFAPGQYQTESPEGRELIAHELVHVAQQRHGGPRLRLSPFAVDPAGADDSASMHDDLGADYAREHPGMSAGGVQYTPGYAQWLRARTADRVRFLPTRYTPHEPLPQRGQFPPRVTGETHLEVNGQPLAGATLGDQIAHLTTLLTPTAVRTSPGLLQGQLNCRFDAAAFRIETGTVVDELTTPPAGGWTGQVDPAVFPPVPAACAGKALVPATLTDPAGPQRIWQTVHDAEQEHVAALRALHQRYLVPYYHEVLALEVSGPDLPTCQARLTARLGRRPQEAALDFRIGDLAEQQTLDDPARGTHLGRVLATPDAGCNAMSIGLTPINPRLPGSAPGNVMPVAPVVTPVDTTALAVAGNTLTSGGRVVRRFASAADAASAMNVLTTLGVTALHSYGTVDLLMAGAVLARGTVRGLPALTFVPARLQVMPPLLAGEWGVGHAVGDQPLLLVGFGAGGRDLAYAAAARLVALGARQQFAADGAANPAMVAYTA